MKLISFDVETSGSEHEYALQPWRVVGGESWLTSVAWHADKDVAELFDQAWLDHNKEPDVERIRKVLVTAAKNHIRIGTWNGPFDIAWLLAHDLKDEVFACQWIDGLLLRKHLYQMATHCNDTRSYSLKAAVAEEYPEHAGYEEDIDFHDTSSEATQARRSYNKKDCIFTNGIIKRYWSKMPLPMRTVALVEAATLPLAAESWLKGLTIDLDAARKLSDDLKKKAASKIVGLSLVNSEVTPKVLASPKQLRKLLFFDWRLPVQTTTPKGEQSTDKLALKKLSVIDKRAAAIYEYREAKLNRTKFAEGAIKSCDYNGGCQTHPQFRIYGTYTGRGSYSSKQGRGKAERPTGVAIHQWKRAPEFRKLIKPPEGYKLVEFDFAGQEFRWMAVVSKDQTMLGLCAPGEDAHSFMGARFVGKEYTDLLGAVRSGDPEAKKQRQLGKVANLSLQYRTGALRLVTMALVQHDVVLSHGQALKLHKLYRRTYPNVVKYWDRQKEHVKRFRTITNLVGRTVNIKPSHDALNSWSDEATAVNFPIQSMGAEQKYLALLVARNMLPKYGGYFYMELHDGLFFVIPDAKVDSAVQEIGTALCDLPYKQAFGLDVPIKFPVDAKVGPSWGELQEVEIYGS